MYICSTGMLAGKACERTVDPDYTKLFIAVVTDIGKADCAAEHGHFRVVELLLEFGAAVDQKDEVVD